MKSKGSNYAYIKSDNLLSLHIIINSTQRQCICESFSDNVSKSKKKQHFKKVHDFLGHPVAGVLSLDERNESTCISFKYVF